MKLNLNFSLLDLEGKEIETANAGKVIANQLCASNKGDALKCYDWGRQLYKGESIEVDRSDLNGIREFVVTTETISNLAKAQILEKIDILKDEKTTGTTSNPNN